MKAEQVIQRGIVINAAQNPSEPYRADSPTKRDINQIQHYLETSARLQPEEGTASNNHCQCTSARPGTTVLAFIAVAAAAATATATILVEGVGFTAAAAATARITGS